MRREADADNLQVRWVQAELHRTAGRLDEADAAYKGFVAYYNGHEVASADDLHYIGLAAAMRVGIATRASSRFWSTTCIPMR